ncbi:hypothetical protein AB1P65_10040 [Roseibium alexandrii]
MSDTCPVIDLSIVWKKLEPKETIPFCRDMVMPVSADTSLECASQGSGRLICEIRIFDKMVRVGY